MSGTKVSMRVEEDEAIVAMIDRIADAEGTSRGAIIRRAVRHYLGFSLPKVPESGIIPIAERQSNEAEQAA